jgi:hypothetical protein
VQGSLPELSIQNVVNKHQKAKENIDKKKISNKQYYDAKKDTKTSKIKEGGIVICKFTILERKGAIVTARNGRRTVPSPVM